MEELLKLSKDCTTLLGVNDKNIKKVVIPSSVKKIYEISFENLRNRTPLNTRNQKEFKEYFDSIWRDLNEC
jgi:hypothetical protein